MPWPRSLVCRSSLRRRALVHGGEIAVTMHDLPLAVFPSVDVRHANGHRLAPAVLGVMVEALEADRVAHVATGLGHLDVPAEVAVGLAREPGRHPAEDAPDLVPSDRVRPPRSEQAHRLLSGPQLHPRPGVAVDDRLLGLGLAREERAEVVALGHAILCEREAVVLCTINAIVPEHAR